MKFDMPRRFLADKMPNRTINERWSKKYTISVLRKRLEKNGYLEVKPLRKLEKLLGKDNEIYREAVRKTAHHFNKEI